MKETEDDSKKWRDIPCSWIRRILLKKKVIYRFNAIPIKILITFFTELEQIILKFTWNHKRRRIAKAVLREKNKAGGITSCTSDTTKLTKTDQYWQRKRERYRPTEQNREPPQKKNPHTYKQLIFDKGVMNIQWGKDSLFSKSCWESWTDACKSPSHGTQK